MSMARSAVVIARLLKCDGVTDFMANEITRYSQRQIGDEERGKLAGHREQFVAVMNTLNQQQKKAVGKFINDHKRLGFDAGLRLGLTAHAVLNERDAPPDEDDFNEALYGPAKPQDRQYRIEAKRDSAWSPIETEKPIYDRASAKEFARAVAMKDGVRVRVLQSGHTVQRYDSRGRKCGGDGD